MSESNDNYIGRKAAAGKYRRGERTLERDISQALKVRNEKFLKHLRLRTKEGDLLPGTDVTFEKIDELKNTGQVPTWEISEAYLAERYGLRSEESPKTDRLQPPEEGTETSASQTDASSSSNQTYVFSETDLPPLPRDPVEQAALLRVLYLNLQRSFQEERQRNEKIFALIETIPKQQEQTNVLLREFQGLMKSGNASIALPRNVETKATAAVQVVEAQPIEVNDILEEETKQPVKSVSKKSPSKKKRSAKSAKKKSPKTPVKTPTFAERHLPSFSRLFGSTPSKKR